MLYIVDKYENEHRWYVGRNNPLRSLDTNVLNDIVEIQADGDEPCEEDCDPDSRASSQEQILLVRL